MKVLISSRTFGKIDSGAVELLKNNGLEPIMNPHGRKLNEQEILNLSDNVVGIIAGTEKITEKIISSNNKLKVISRYVIGLDNVDLKAAAQKNVMVYNTPETPTVAVAEFALSLIFSLLKKINNADKNLRNNQWKPESSNKGFEAMKKKAIYVLILSLLSVPCYAGPIFSTLGPGDTYDTSTGWIVGKSSPFPEDVDSANQFSFGGFTSYYLDTIELAAALYSGTNELDVWLMSDTAGLPGTIIETFNFVDAVG